MIRVRRLLRLLCTETAQDSLVQPHMLILRVLCSLRSSTGVLALCCVSTCS